MSLPEGFLTLLPPPLEWPSRDVDIYVDTAINVLKRLGSGTAVNVPEVVPHGRKPGRPMPFKPKLDLLHFARILKDRGVNVYVDRYVPLIAREEFNRFLREASGVVQGVVVVGKIKSSMDSPGYSVEEGIERAKGYFGNVGAITIFEREDEVERVCRKIKAGANFLISQITFHPGRVREFTRALTKKCYEKNLKYPPLYVSVAPIYGRRDVEFLNWMDVDVPSDVPDISSLVEEMTKIPGVSGINHEHIRYTNLKRLYDLRPPP